MIRPRPTTNLGELFHDVAQQRPHDIALIYDSEWYTFRELDQLSTNLSRSLINKYDVSKGDLVALSLRNSPEWIISLIAIVSIGAVVVPIEGWDLLEFRSLFTSHHVQVAIVDDKRIFRLDSVLKTETEGTNQGLNGVILCRSPTNGMLPFVDHWRSVVQSPSVREPSVEETLSDLLRLYPEQQQQRVPSKQRTTATTAKTTIAKTTAAKTTAAKTIRDGSRYVTRTDVACAIPVASDPFRGSSLVEMTHEDWMRMAEDGLEEQGLPEKKTIQNRKDERRRERRERKETRETRNEDLSKDPVALFCPVPLLTLLRGETVRIRKEREEDRTTTKMKKMRSEIDWSSSWVQTLQHVVEEVVESKDKQILCSARMVAVDAVEEESPIRLFTHKCEEGLRSHPLVRAASMFVHPSVKFDGGSSDGNSNGSAVREERRGEDSAAAMTLWGAVVLDESSGATLPSLNELLELCPRYYVPGDVNDDIRKGNEEEEVMENMLSIRGLVKWQQRGMSTAVRMARL